MQQDELNKKAIEILKSNIYMTLATTDGKLPWAAPVFYCLDEDFNFYFISQMDSLHTVHILKQPKVAFAVFDSHQAEGQGNGVQGTGIVHLLEGVDVVEGLKHYSTTFIEMKPEILASPAPYRLFKLETDSFFVLDPEAPTDKRVKVVVR